MTASTEQDAPETGDETVEMYSIYFDLGVIGRENWDPIIGWPLESDDECHSWRQRDELEIRFEVVRAYLCKATQSFRHYHGSNLLVMGTRTSCVRNSRQAQACRIHRQCDCRENHVTRKRMPTTSECTPVAVITPQAHAAILRSVRELLYEC